MKSMAMPACMAGACLFLAALLPVAAKAAPAAAAQAAARQATEDEYRSIRESLKPRLADADSATLRDVVVGSDRNDPASRVQIVCGYAGSTRFYGTVSTKDDGKPYVLILGTDVIANTLCAEKLGI